MAPPEGSRRRAAERRQADRIIVSSILKRVRALTACGWLAGISTMRPAATVSGVPAMEISASPSRTCATASNGAVCSLRA